MASDQVLTSLWDTLCNSCTNLSKSVRFNSAKVVDNVQRFAVQVEDLHKLLGVFIRRRKVYELTIENGKKVAKDTVVEYDVAGTCALDKAEAMELDPGLLEEVVNQVDESYNGADSMIRFSYDIVLAKSNPEVCAMDGIPRKLFSHELKGKLVLAVVWSTWSKQSQHVIRLVQALIKSHWDGVVSFVGISVDDHFEKLQAFVDENGELLPKSCCFWSGLGLSGNWKGSPVAKAFALGSIPSLMIFDGQGKLVHESVFLENDEYETNPVELDRLFGESEAELICNKINSMLASLPRKPTSSSPSSEPCFESQEALGTYISMVFATVAHEDIDTVKVFVDEVWETKNIMKHCLVAFCEVKLKNPDALNNNESLVKMLTQHLPRLKIIRKN